MEFLRPVTRDSVAVRWWQVQFAFGTLACEGRTMTSVAAELGVERATISKGATDVCRRCKMQPSWYMKNEDAAESYKESRKKQVSP